MPAQPTSTPAAAPASQENIRRVESGMRVCSSFTVPAMKSRTRAAPTIRSATSVAVLSLWLIIASRTVRAEAEPARFSVAFGWAPNTGLLSERIPSSMVTCSVSERRPASTSRR